MKIWVVCFGVLFAIAELFQWLEQLTLPLPIYILGGVCLAIASNQNKQASFNSSTQTSSTKLDSTAIVSLPTAPQPSKSISFTISRSAEDRGEEL